jgi:hypothetical protein
MPCLRPAGYGAAGPLVGLDEARMSAFLIRGSSNNRSQTFNFYKTRSMTKPQPASPEPKRGRRRRFRTFNIKPLIFPKRIQ